MVLGVRVVEPMGDGVAEVVVELVGDGVPAEARSVQWTFNNRAAQKGAGNRETIIQHTQRTNLMPSKAMPIVENIPHQCLLMQLKTESRCKHKRSPVSSPCNAMWGLTPDAVVVERGMVEVVAVHDKVRELV